LLGRVPVVPVVDRARSAAGPGRALFLRGVCLLRHVGAAGGGADAARVAAQPVRRGLGLVPVAVLRHGRVRAIAGRVPAPAASPPFSPFQYWITAASGRSPGEFSFQPIARCPVACTESANRATISRYAFSGVEWDSSPPMWR